MCAPQEHPRTRHTQIVLAGAPMHALHLPALAHILDPFFLALAMAILMTPALGCLAFLMMLAPGSLEFLTRLPSDIFLYFFYLVLRFRHITSMVTSSKPPQTQYIRTFHGNHCSKKLLGGSYCNSTAKVSFLTEKAMLMSKKK